MKPSAYKHIAAWFQAMGALTDVRVDTRRWQAAAARDNAPIDAVYYDGSTGRWATIADVGVQTRMSIERALNHGVTRK